ncbi:hypothetical protein [Massilia sp. YIM B04103]|uniref:hypothetical protein n=1 Tax=Massilia sp. YIM B04103 TaxID=2963106 RepID=UPI00210A099F|nr:hypothetical protein [Massilia sp. YIM B04103]
MTELQNADARALHAPYSTVLATQAPDDAFRWISAVLSAQSSNLRSSNSHLVAYTGSDLALDWLEANVSSPVASQWGRGAALLGAPWPRVAAWLKSGGPLMLMGLDTLVAYRNPAPNMAPLAQIAAPVLSQAPSHSEFNEAVLDVLKAGSTPRIKSSVDAVYGIPTRYLAVSAEEWQCVTCRLSSLIPKNLSMANRFSNNTIRSSRESEIS